MVKKAAGWMAALAVAATVLAGCGSGGGTDTGAPAPVVPSDPAPSSTTAQPEPSDSAKPEPTASKPADKPSKPAEKPKDDKLRRGDEGAEVVALQERLAELGYWNGKADGKFGGTTQQAVFALQKAAGLGRDGVVGAKTRRALERGVRPKARSDSGRVVEIDKKKQLLMLVDDGRVETILNTSTGSGERYETTSGGTAIASTPAGKFRVSRQIDGWRNAPLGMLWRPKYFNGGIAVHGAHSIPPYPASHGCARLSISAMNWIWANDKMPRGTRVWVY